MDSRTFAREFAHLLARYDKSYADIRQGVISFQDGSVVLPTLRIENNGYFVKIIDHFGEPFHQITENTVRVIEQGSHPRDTCDRCGSTFKRRWFGLLRSPFCMNPSCDNHDERGFEVIPTAKTAESSHSLDRK